MSRRLHALILCLAAAMLVVLVGGPAVAATATVRDARGDAAAGVDIVRATYVNADRFVQFRVKVRDLGRRGRFDFVVAQPRSDNIMVARVTRGRLRWGVQDLMGTTWIGCSGASYRWLQARDIVRVRVPRGCLNRSGFRGRLYMQARSDNGSWDYAPSRVVRRG